MRLDWPPALLKNRGPSFLVRADPHVTGWGPRPAWSYTVGPPGLAEEAATTEAEIVTVTKATEIAVATEVTITEA